MRHDPSGRDRLREVLDLPEDLAAGGYLDLVGDEEPEARGLAQRLMLSRAVPLVYERWWRPALGRVAKGPGGPSMAEEVAAAQRLLELDVGAVVVDVACGPGNFTRAFARAVGDDGLVIGADVSPTMLARGVAATDDANVVYVRCPAAALPLRPGAVDAVCCFAALHLFDDPSAALDTMVAGLAPGGRIAVFTSCRSSRLPLGPLATLIGRLGGMRMFGRDAVTGALTRRGLEITAQRVAGATQIVGARRP